MRLTTTGDGEPYIQLLFTADSDTNLGPQEGCVYGHENLRAMARGIVELLKEHPEKSTSPPQQVD